MSDSRPSRSRSKSLLLLGWLILASPASAAVFNYIPTPIDVSPGATGWQDVNVSAYVPVGATGVIVEWQATGTDQNYGVRMKGSSDGNFPSGAKGGQHGWLMTGLDANRTFQVFSGNAAIKTYLLGYTMPGVKFFTNRIDKSTTTLSPTWADVSIASDTGADTAIGAIFHVTCTAGSGSSCVYAIRKKGSTDNRYFEARPDVGNVVLIGVDDLETAQQKIVSTSVDLYLVGYVTSGAVFFTNGIDKTTTSSSYVPVDLTNDLGANNANGAFVEIYNDSGNDRNAALRQNGVTLWDPYLLTRHQWTLVGIDSGDIYEQRSQNTEMHYFLTGYSLAGASSDFRVKSGSYVGNGTGQSITGVGFTPDVVILDNDGGGGQAVIRTNTMTGLNSKDMDAPNVFATGQITSLDADGFSVGTDNDANLNGITYYWVAFKAAPGYMKLGTYAGAAGAQNIGGVGFTPAYVLVMSPLAEPVIQKADLMPATFSMRVAATGYTDAILDIQGNGFRVGTNTAVNGAGTTFHYVAWNRVPGRIAVGSYTGDKTDDRNITGVGFWPEYVIVDRSTNAAGGQGDSPAHKPASTGTGTDVSLRFNSNLVEADNIQALQSDGFQVGTNCRVNGDGTCAAPVPVAYYYAAFGPHTASGLYRSAGTNAANLNGLGRTVTISGTTASFSGSMPANVGVGDVLQYQVTGTWYLAFIHGRTSDMVYTVRSASGGTPQPAVAGTAVGVYRAYTSLSNWQALTGNASLQPSVLPFDTSRDLVAAGGPMHVACYRDGQMDDTVSVTGWTTSPGTYVRIFTPVKASEVGASQRHTGVAGTGFRLRPISAADQGFNIISLSVPYARIEGLEIDGSSLTNSQATRGITVAQGITNIGDLRVDSCLIHDLHTTSSSALVSEGSMGILDFQLSASVGPPMIVTNNIIYDITNNQMVGHIGGIHIGSRATSYVLNNTVYAINNFTGCAGDCGPSWGIYAKASGGGTVNVVVQNNYVGNVTGKNGPNIFCYDTESGGILVQSYNVSSDNTAAGTGSQINKTAYATYFQSIVNGSENLHLTAASSLVTMFNAAGTDLSPAFFNDIDGQLRTVAWDIGADEFDGTTAVKLMSFEALPGDRSVTLQWRTGSELSNLGFHVYRAPSADGPWARLTSSLVPGLGTSAVGQDYSWHDSGLENGVRYYYRLEDVDTAARSTMHGPLSAVPVAGAPVADDGKGSGGGSGRSSKARPGPSCPAWVLASSGLSASDAPQCTRHGDPEAVSLEVVSRTSGSAVIELRTGGFYALHERDGSVRVFVQGFDSPSEATAAALPLRRALVAAVAGRRVRLVSAAPFEQARFAGLRPSAVGVADMDVSWDGTVRPRRRALAAAHAKGGLRLPPVARLAPSVFQGENKSAVVEIMPIRFDEKRQALVLARRVRVRLAFSGREAGESGSGRRGRARPRREPAVSGEVLAQLHTSGRGLYAAPFEALFSDRRATVASSQLSLERQGEPVPFHVEPAGDVFGPGSTLYFFSEREAASTDYSGEVAFELVRSSGAPMAVASARPRGPAVASSPIALATAETNKIYQPGLLDAPDIWLWAALVGGGAAQAVAVTLDGLDTTSEQPVELAAELQGGSESGQPNEHHVRLSLGGTPMGEARFAGKLPHRLSASVPAPQLADGANTLELANLGDAGVYSLAFLDRLEVRYPRLRVLRQGCFEGTLADSGTLELASVTRPVAALDVTGAATWLVGLEAGPGVVRFRAEAGHRYLVVSRDGLRSPRIVRPGRSELQSASNQADYIVVAPRAFLDAARPLVERRASQGLTTIAAPFEEIAEAFGHGQPSAEAIRDFLSFAFQSWKRPSPRYVLLLGDASYDPRGFVSSMASPLPALWTKTSYLWTASDPELAAVNGADALPDLAIGRLPATTVAEAEALVAKTLAWEDSGQGLAGTAVLVADNPDVAGDFEADVEDVRASFFASRPTTTIKLRELGAGTRPAILGAFDDGSSFVSYVGHGGAAVWASENVLNIWDVPSLRAQSRQPLLLTLNCLNGYFVASSYDSLSEALLKADGRGVIAAFSPSGLSLDGPAHLYHRAVLGEVTSGRHARLGDALLAAQALYAEAGVAPELVSVYHLLGDPALAIR